jgi:DNA-binding protein HU-beta
MRKADLFNEIANKTGVPKVDVMIALEAFFQEVKSNVERGESVFVRGFGTFHAKKRARKIGRNIKKNTAVVIPEHYVPAFKPADAFVERVKNGSRAPERVTV